MRYALDLLLLNMLCWGGQAQDVVLTTEPNWSTFYLGESVTFRCYVNGGEETNWEYKITRRSEDTFAYDLQKSYTLEDLKITEFQCSARRRGVYKKSKTIYLIVLAEKPRATLTAGPTTIPVGGSVTLRCLIESSVGRKYRWFRLISGTSEEISTGHEENRAITVKQGGIYWCEGQREKPPFYSRPSHDVTVKKTLSNKVVVSCQPNGPHIIIGETITLTCEVQGGETAAWVCDWRRSGSFIHRTCSKDWTFRVSESSSGDYICHCRRRDDWYALTRWSENITLSVSVSKKVFVTRQPNWPQIFSGEWITLTCEIQGGETTEWTCDWRRDGSVILRTDSKAWTFRVSESSSGCYMCQCRRRDDWFSSTRWSETIKLSVAGKPMATLRVGSTTIPIGGSVTLSCSVEPSAGWKYRLFRQTSDTPEVQVRTNNEGNRDITVTRGGIYRCEGERGRAESYSGSSDEVTVHISFSNEVVATRRPNWPQMFSGETITLTCEVQGGETTEWTCDWRRSGLASHRAYGKDWTLRLSDSSGGDYMCRCRRRDDWYSSTKWSEAITLFVSDKPTAKLMVGPTTIPVGGSVTLICSVEPSAGWKYRLFSWPSHTHGVQVRTNNEENKYFTVAQGGLYRCEGERGNPKFYTESSDDVTIQISFSNEVFVARQPNWPQMFSGESITLACEVQGGETTEWTCEWMRSASVIQRTDSKDWTFIVSESSSGDYTCQCRPRDDGLSLTRWSEAITLSVSVTVSSPASSSFPVMFIIGPLVGIILIILLLLLWRYRLSKDLSCLRSFQSESSSRRPTANHGANKTEGDYSSLLHGTTSIYQIILPRGAAGNERPYHQEDSSVYVNVRPGNNSSA
ncbi:LOW QUALITY PROTEIN: B-cell receptor CD22-like [Poeciliopsis prolifica]|uniref:LOW QUALITY PROTEIN: B-cell receptor CD22-like n=1 Tax=Poeciliopsis prolifica TaxID=188132 RepID=UPI0024140FAF|nr:LOW QUALITY PROTEIN: B-cell receptor CD22-like [Poeciliopsis prolifica]